MFILPDGRPISPDVAFTLNDIQYPQNWLRLSTFEERAAIGISEVPDPAPYDQRFYWGPNNPKDHTQLVEQWSQQTRTTAGTLLAPSDWLVIRETDNATPVPTEWRTWREAIRTATGVKIDAIEATTTTEELAAYITGADYPAWPADPSQPAPAPAEADVIAIPEDAIASGGAV
jgi:hypothetical protein